MIIIGQEINWLGELGYMSRVQETNGSDCQSGSCMNLCSYPSLADFYRTWKRRRILMQRDRPINAERAVAMTPFLKVLCLRGTPAVAFVSVRGGTAKILVHISSRGNLQKIKINFPNIFPREKVFSKNMHCWKCLSVVRHLKKSAEYLHTLKDSYFLKICAAQNVYVLNCILKYLLLKIFTCWKLYF